MARTRLVQAPDPVTIMRCWPAYPHTHYTTRTVQQPPYTYPTHLISNKGASRTEVCLGNKIVLLHETATTLITGMSFSDRNGTCLFSRTQFGDPARNLSASPLPWLQTHLLGWSCLRSYFPTFSREVA